MAENVKKLILSSLLFLWVYASAFQSLAINIGGNPLFVYFLAQIVLLIFAFLFVKNKELKKIPHGDMILFIFCTYAVISSFVLSLFFEGVEVFSPRISIDDQVGYLGQVQFGVGNIAQSIYLISNVLLFFLMGRSSVSVPREKIFTYALFVGSLTASISVYFDWAAPDLWKSFSPYFRTNEAGLLFEEMQIDGERRVFGIFSEPSYAGIYLAASAAFFFLCSAGGWYKILVRFYSLLLFFSSILTTSFTAYICVCVFFAYMMARWLKLTKKQIIFWGIVFLLIAAMQSGSIEISKIDSLSVINRLASDLRSFEIVSETYGFGVGLGSHRASSLFSTLLATVGLIGFFLFIYFLYVFFSIKSNEKNLTAIKIYAFIIIFANMIACAEISSPFFWTALVCLPGFNERRKVI